MPYTYKQAKRKSLLPRDENSAYSSLMVAKGKATIQNEAGIHCRPSSFIIKSVQDYPGKIRVAHEENGECDLRSMLDLMMMGLTCGSSVELEVEGPQEEAQLQSVTDLFEKIYDFPNAGDKK
jgi:phosphotransferase system HPr (HPr) family protein